MRHGVSKTAKRSGKTLTKSLFSSHRGSHSAHAVRAQQAAGADGAVLGLDDAVAQKINEIAPMTRRAIRESARAAQRKTNILYSASLAALVGTAATAVTFARASADTVASDTTTTTLTRISPSAASRSDARDGIGTIADQNNGGWSMGETNEVSDVNAMSKSIANNPAVAQRLDKDINAVPQGFNPNHETSDNGNAYPWGQCTWWTYERRHQLGLNTGSHFGNAQSWANSARSLGYWVDNTPRATGDAVVFAPGQANADGYYGHVAVVEKVNPDGSIEISESNAKGLGVISNRTFSAAEAAQFQYIHY